MSAAEEADDQGGAIRFSHYGAGTDSQAKEHSYFINSTKGLEKVCPDEFL
jgi:hypothetical protein